MKENFPKDLIKIGAHVALTECALDHFGMTCYKDGYEACKQHIIDDLSRVIKDETLKAILLERVQDYKSKVHYIWE